VLEVIETDGLMENAKIVGNYLMDQMRELASRHQCIGDVRYMSNCREISVLIEVTASVELNELVDSL